MIARVQADYILAARVRGVPPRRLLLRYAFPSSFSLVTPAGPSLGALIRGAIVVEVLFALPSVGHAMVDSEYGKDLPAVRESSGSSRSRTL
jgi:peptide/nickel transport system permease protein